MAKTKKNELNQDITQIEGLEPEGLENNSHQENSSYITMTTSLGVKNVNYVKGITAQCHSKGEQNPAELGDSMASAGTRPGNEDGPSSSAEAGALEAFFSITSAIHGMPEVVTEPMASEIADGKDPVNTQKEGQQLAEHLTLLTTQVPERKEQYTNTMLSIASPPECRPGASTREEEEQRQSFDYAIPPA